MENTFKKSSYCGSNACVEVKIEGDNVFIKDSDGDYVIFNIAEWRAFIAGVKEGEFDENTYHRLPRLG